MVDQTQKCIRDGMIALLKKKNFSEIQMKEIADRAHVGRSTLYRYFDSKESILEHIAETQMAVFAEEILKEKAMTLQSVVRAFFIFAEKNRAEFAILKRAHLMNYVEDHLFELVKQVAARTKYKDMSQQEMEEQLNTAESADHYALHFIIGGGWRTAMVWLEEENRPSPDEMAQIVENIIAHGISAGK